MSDTECPTCGRDDFESTKGLKIHHQKLHNKPLGDIKFTCKYCAKGFEDKNGLHKHHYRLPSHRNREYECKVCNKEYDNLGNHWQSSGHYPSISDEQHQIITGILMGDGTVERRSKNPSMKIQMISPDYLSYISDIFGGLSTSVKEYDYDKDSYFLRIRSHPELSRYAEWYETGEKVFPRDVELTPKVLKHWYCCDGTKNRPGGSVGNPRIIIFMSNEWRNTDKIDSYFKCQNLPTPSNYLTRERETGMSCAAQFTISDSIKLWEYMGEPLPDFEYKWPDQNY